MAKTRQEAIAELTAPGETYELYEGCTWPEMSEIQKRATHATRLFRKQRVKSNFSFTRIRV